MTNNKKIKIDLKAWISKLKALPKNKKIAYGVLALGVVLLIIGLLI